MQIFNLHLFISLSFAFLFTIQCLEPSPAPISGSDTGSPDVSYGPPLPALSDPPVPMAVEEGEQMDEDVEKEEGSKASGEVPAAAEVVKGPEPEVVKWCAVREEDYKECESMVTVLSEEPDGYTYKCIKRTTTQQCLESVKIGEADLINLEAGLAYTAFLNYSMKAIASEVFCDQAESYDAVAIVNRKVCKQKEQITLMDFKGLKSCHGGYSTAAGWNYPIDRIGKLFTSAKMNDQQIATNFFSKVCAPSEFEGGGVCSGCGDGNGTCYLDSNGLYYGHSGAFRCLVEELGDIAFVKGDTALLYSMEGPLNQSWSTKSVRDFMYLCPEGGCREINGYPRSCSFGSVPANMIMASNSIANNKRLLILQKLTNATWRHALHRGKSTPSHLFSPSTQDLAVVKMLTRLYLGESASVSETILNLSTQDDQAIALLKNSTSDAEHSGVTRVWSVVFLVLIFMVITKK